jgi:hypothetical protein
LINIRGSTEVALSFNEIGECHVSY